MSQLQYARDKKMNIINKFIGYICAVSICLCMGITTYAAEEGTISNPKKITLGKTYKETWLMYDYSDRYMEFTISKKGIVKVAATKPIDENSYSQLSMYIYDKKGDLIARNLGVDVDSVSEKYELFVGLDAGTYILKFVNEDNYMNEDIFTNYSVSLEANDYCEIESNDSSATATSMVLGKTYTGYLGVDSESYYDEDVDYYKVKLTKDNRYKIYISNISDGYLDTCEIITPGGDSKSIEYSLDTDKNGNQYYLYDVKETGLYAIKLEDDSSQYKYTIGVKLENKKTQNITGVSNSYTIEYEGDYYNYSADFSISPKAKGEITITSSDKEICNAYDDGDIYIYKYGQVIITITAEETDEFKAAEKKIKLNIVPKRSKINSAKNVSGNKFEISWDKGNDVSGYELQIARNKSFSKSVKKYVFNDEYTTKTTQNLTEPEYYLRIRAYVSQDGKKYYSPWSATKKIERKASLNLNQSKLNLCVGTKATIKAAKFPSSVKLTWKTSNKRVATVSKGTIKGVKKGTATITASFKYKGKKYTKKCRVTVKNPSINLNKSNISIGTGDMYTLVATTTPSGAKVSWSSSKPSVASVTSSGVVTGKKKGTTIITAKIKYKGKTYKKSCKVTVKKSYFSEVKNYILRNGSVNSDGYRFINAKDITSELSTNVGIVYDSDKDCLRFTLIVENYDSNIKQSVSFELYSSKKTVNVEQIIIITNAKCACEASYTLPIAKYNSNYQFTMSIETTGVLSSSDYVETLSSGDDLAFTMWEVLLKNRLGIGLNELGFVSYK